MGRGEDDGDCIGEEDVKVDERPGGRVWKGERRRDSTEEDYQLHHEHQNWRLKMQKGVTFGL